MGVKELSIQAISQAVCNIRSSKLPNHQKLEMQVASLKTRKCKGKYEFLKLQFPGIVAYELENGNVKLAAGWLIEQAGWKGKMFGDAGVHKLQALVLVNYGNAKAAKYLSFLKK